MTTTAMQKCRLTTLMACLQRCSGMQQHTRQRHQQLLQLQRLLAPFLLLLTLLLYPQRKRCPCLPATASQRHLCCMQPWHKQQQQLQPNMPTFQHHSQRQMPQQQHKHKHQLLAV